MDSANPTRPLWFYLLEEQGKEAWGLTPSYLIGAELPNRDTTLDADAAYARLCSLLESFSSAPRGLPGRDLPVQHSWPADRRVVRSQ